jgi:hypothetical protein
MKGALTVFFLLLIVANSYAKNKLQTGLTIGYNTSTFIGNDIPGKGLKSIPGMYLGGIINYPINERFSLLSNISLCSRGTKINTISDLYASVYFFYIDIPIMAKMNFFIDKKISPYVLLGGAFDYNIVALGTSGYLYDIKKIDLGIIPGLGFDAGRISLGVRYYYGLTKFDDSDLNLDLRNSTLSFLADIRFNK